MERIKALTAITGNTGAALKDILNSDYDTSTWGSNVAESLGDNAEGNQQLEALLDELYQQDFEDIVSSLAHAHLCHVKKP